MPITQNVVLPHEGHIRAVSTLASPSPLEAHTLRLVVCTLCMVLVSMPAALAWNEPAGFRNIPWGASPEIVRQHLPDFHCRRESQIPNCAGYLMIGSIRVFTLIEFQTGGMDTVMFDFPSEEYVAMKHIFRERYGPPTETETEPVQNRMGATFLNERLRWRGNVVKITLEKYGSKLTDSSALLITNKASALSQQRIKDRGKAGKKDL